MNAKLMTGTWDHIYLKLKSWPILVEDESLGSLCINNQNSTLFVEVT